MRRSLAPPKPPSPPTLDEMKAMAEIHRFKQQMEHKNAMDLMLMMNVMQPMRPAERIDIDELIDQFTKPLEEMKAREAGGNGLEETIRVLGPLFINRLPRTGLEEKILQWFLDYMVEKPKRDRKNRLALAKLLSEKRRRWNPDLELINRRSKIIMDNSRRMWI